MPKSLTVRVGSPSYLSGGSIVNVKQLVMYDKYISTLHANDFGLIELTDKLNYTKDIQPILVPSSNDSMINNGTLCTVHSWGRYSNISST